MPNLAQMPGQTPNLAQMPGHSESTPQALLRLSLHTVGEQLGIHSTQKSGLKN